MPDATPPGYVIGHMTVSDMEGYRTYTARVPATLAPFGGEFLVRGGAAIEPEGRQAGSRHVVIRFPSRAAAEAWYASPAYQEIIPLRQAYATGALTIVEGYAP